MIQSYRCTRLPLTLETVTPMTPTLTAYKSLIEHLTQLSDSDQVEAVLAALLSDKEVQDIDNRVRIFDLLQQGATQRTISQQLGVGIATVSRGAKAFQGQQDEAIDNLLAVHRQLNQP